MLSLTYLWYLIVSFMEVTLVLFYLLYLLTQSLSGSQRLNLFSLQMRQTFSLKLIVLINAISYNLNSTFLQIGCIVLILALIQTNFTLCIFSWKRSSIQHNYSFNGTTLDHVFLYKTLGIHYTPWLNLQ